MRKRLFSVGALLLMLLAVWGLSLKAGSGEESEGEAQLTKAESEQEGLFSVNDKKTIHVWYTEEAMTDYLLEKAMEYSADHEDVRVLPTLVPQSEYLESIYDTSVSESAKTAMPDVFLTTNDTLEKAYLSGVAVPIEDEKGQVNENNFPSSALHAVTYHGKKIAYPFYYETAFFLYNRTYLEEMAKSHNEALADRAEAEAAQAQTEAALEAGEDMDEAMADEAGEQESYEQVSADELIPATFEDILELANDFDAPEGMESILKWDVTDVFYNYFFAGNYMTIGGEDGDDPSQIDLCNMQTVACMEVYQALRPFFSIEAKDSDYDTILTEFIDGKTLFTVATTDALAKLREAAADGRFKGEYGISLLPELTSNLSSRGLSVTNVAVVNGFGPCREEADRFAAFLTCEADKSLYEKTGRLSAGKNIVYDDECAGGCMLAYEKSIGLPKIMEASNFWMQLEITMTGIWEGDDTQEAMEKLQQQMQSQVGRAKKSDT